MDLFAVDQPEPDRHAIVIDARWTAVVLMPRGGNVMMGFFLDGELVHTFERAAGDA